MDTEMYFDEMNILQSEKEKRVSMANSLTKDIKHEFDRFSDDKSQNKDDNHKNHLALIILGWMVLFDLVDKRKYEENKERIDNYVTDTLYSTSTDLGLEESEVKLLEQLKQSAYDISKTTESHSEIEYYTSGNRAENIARDFTNKFLNLSDFEFAKESGFRYKIWKTMDDKFVRLSHALVSNEKIPIDEPFVVGGCYMMYPMDSSYGASAGEVGGCRCTVIYSKN